MSIPVTIDLLELLNSEDENLQMFGAKIAGWKKMSEATDILIKMNGLALTGDAQHCFINAIAEIGDEKGMRYLVRLLPEWDSAFKALERKGSLAAPFLLEAYNDPDVRYKVFIEVVRMLKILKVIADAGPILKILQREHWMDQCENLVPYLEIIDDASIIKLLFDILENHPPISGKFIEDCERRRDFGLHSEVNYYYNTNITRFYIIEVICKLGESKEDYQAIKDYLEKNAISESSYVDPRHGYAIFISNLLCEFEERLLNNQQN